MNITGTITSKRRDGKGIKIGEDWYSVMFSSALDGFERGDYVDVEYTTKPSPAGPDYRNIKGIKKATPPASMPVSAPAASPTARVFPVPGLSPERAIIRQNSLGHAVEVVKKMCWDVDGDCLFEDANEMAEKVIEVARMFEAYSSGDLDRDMVEDEVKKMLAKETS